MDLYLDNFRGFSDTFVPISDVNFLVGENSTGKTSVLGLLKLFGTMEFWFGQSFDIEEISFGHFQDIVSVHADNRSYFRIGLIYYSQIRKTEKSNTKAQEQRPTGFLATYKEYQGLPQLSRFTFIDGRLQHTLKFTKSGVLYKSSLVGNADTRDELRTRVFEGWLKEHRSGKSGYRKLPIPEHYPRQASQDLILAMSVVRNLSEPDSSEFKGPGITFSFYFPTPLEHVVWMAPIRTQPRRTYDEVRFDYHPEGTHTPYVIRKLLDSKREADQFLSFMRRIGRSSGLFESIGIKRYGRSITAPFEVDIVLDSKALNLSSVGYGVSQSLPVIVELFIRPKGTWFAIQQPEVHLHPRAQASLGDLFFDLAIQEEKVFLIETHSDYTIDRFRMNYRRSKTRPPEAQVLFFERKKGKNIVSAIQIGSKGELSRNQPKSYRQFFLKEQLRALGI